jgi:hypothetical protein
LGTSYVHAGGRADEGGKFFGGGVAVLFLYNAALVGIAKDARVNQRFRSLWITLPEQDVIVHADAEIESVNFGGNSSVVDWIGGAVSGQSQSIGGYFDGIIQQNRAWASIDDLAAVYAERDLQVTAEADSKVVTVVVAGGYATKLGVDGAFIYDRLDNDAEAWIEDRAQVWVLHDVILDAQTDTPGL